MTRVLLLGLCALAGCGSTHVVELRNGTGANMRAELLSYEEDQTPDVYADVASGGRVLMRVERSGISKRLLRVTQEGMELERWVRENGAVRGEVVRAGEGLWLREDPPVEWGPAYGE